MRLICRQIRLIAVVFRVSGQIPPIATLGFLNSSYIFGWEFVIILKVMSSALRTLYEKSILYHFTFTKDRHLYWNIPAFQYMFIRMLYFQVARETILEFFLRLIPTKFTLRKKYLLGLEIPSEVVKYLSSENPVPIVILWSSKQKIYQKLGE